MAKRTPEQTVRRLEQQLARARDRQRRKDAHRKITLGGIVIAAGADVLDPAELCGWLVTLLEKRTDQTAHQMKERGLVVFANRRGQIQPKS